MQKLKYTVTFTTPAFLGDAEQTGQWRTPPFKALLRQWWRVAYAADHGFRVNVADMRREEGLLFGNAWLSHRQGNREVTDHSKSLVRLRLDRWTRPNIGNLPGTGVVCHPEVNRPGLQNCAGGAPGKLVDAGQYLGYGPFQKPNAAIQAGESAMFSLVWPEAFPDDLRKKLEESGAPDIYPEAIDARLSRALWLMDRYGALGGRSRNGWGSFSLTPVEDTPALEGKSSLRDWKQCLDRDWPHAIGQDDQGRPLIWQTRAFDDWKALMRELAIVKIGLRTQFVFPNVAPPHAGIEPRHWLSYPITRHTTRAWDRGARLPNPLRFKVRKTKNDKLVGVIFHMPHLPPAAFNPNRAAIERAWQQVHALLDHLKYDPPRTYPMIPEVAPVNRRSALKPHLDTVTLERISK